LDADENSRCSDQDEVYLLLFRPAQSEITILNKEVIIAI